MNSDNAKPGRPPKSGETQNTRLYLRAISSDKQLFEDAAAAAGMTLSDWVREQLVAAAKKELGLENEL